VRRAGTAPDGVEEWVGDFHDADFAASFAAGANAVVTTVHPMGSDRNAQKRIGVEGTTVVARAARDAGGDRLVHVSTAAVYDRSPGVGDVDEGSALVGDDGNDYAVTKRDTDGSIAAIDGLTRVLVRPPAILGAGETSVWNTLRPQRFRDHPGKRRAHPDQTFAWVHVEDLAAFLADLATGADGPAAGECTPVNLAAEPTPARTYWEAVAAAVGVEPEWLDGPAWTGRIVADRARAWGWSPAVGLDRAMTELAEGLQ
jgi:nucleoside-diphosphate-sugar epimerase